MSLNFNSCSGWVTNECRYLAGDIPGRPLCRHCVTVGDLRQLRRAVAEWRVLRPALEGHQNCPAALSPRHKCRFNDGFGLLLPLLLLRLLPTAGEHWLGITEPPLSTGRRRGDIGPGPGWARSAATLPGLGRWAGSGLAINRLKNGCSTPGAIKSRRMDKPASSRSKFPDCDSAPRVADCNA